MILFAAGISVGVVIAALLLRWLYRRAEHNAFLRFWG